MTRSLLERFEEKYFPEPNSGCWLWTASISVKGYGKLGSQHAHRVSYEIHKGPIAGGEIDHKCCVRSCVNPDHLQVVSHHKNILLTKERGRKRRVKSICKNGHDIDANAYYWRGVRYCRSCRASSSRAKHRREAGIPLDAPPMNPSARTHCPRGHELVGENIYWQGHKRSCLTCRRTYRQRTAK